MLTIKEAAPTDRVNRRPRHKFMLRQRPYQIQPFMIAPVLPGESLDLTHIQVRQVSDPLVSPIIGWASEWMLFYVKIRDLGNRDTLDDLFINPTANVSALNTVADTPTYHPGGCPNYTSMCLQRVTETFFRDEGETWNANLIGTLPAAQVMDQAWLDSVVDTTVLPDGGAIAGGTTAEGVDKLLDAYEYLRSMNLTVLSFEDYCRTFGVSIAREVVNKPEVIARKKAWTYPSNTIDPTTGAPTSACSWVIDENFRDKKFFKEPGFIFGVSVIRPKVYMQNLKGSLAHFLDTGLSWLPAIMRDQPETSLREFTNANGPISGATNGYWVDMRDLFIYGDQFANFALTATDCHAMGIPTAALTRKYLTATDVDELFKTPGTANLVRSDGVCQLTIKGSLQDMTGGHQAERGYRS